MNATARKSLRYIGWAIGAVLAASAFVWLCGLMIPARHEASASLRVDADPEAILAVLAPVEGYPRWRSDVAKVEVPGPASAVDGIDAGRWRETDADGRSTEHEAAMAPGPGGNASRGGRGSIRPRKGGAEKWVERSVTGDGRVRIERTFLIVAEENGGTLVALTEKTDLRNPFARFRARFVTGYAENANALLNDLRRRLGE
jgi:hypothetical protein